MSQNLNDSSDWACESSPLFCILLFAIRRRNGLIWTHWMHHSPASNLDLTWHGYKSIVSHGNKMVVEGATTQSILARGITSPFLQARIFCVDKPYQIEPKNWHATTFSACP
jgi:hypothetical protein